MPLLLRLILNALAVILVSYIVPGVQVDGFFTALVTAFVMGLINAVIRPILLVLSLPINILTLGLFTLVINALMFWLASALVPGFQVAGFGSALIGAIVFWLIAWATNVLVRDQAVS
ncbi:phage holin family protein [Patescibacteria group bacterium]|nr:phage holin family protein [Patescibacteria group bacterium]